MNKKTRTLAAILTTPLLIGLLSYQSPSIADFKIDGKNDGLPYDISNLKPSSISKGTLSSTQVNGATTVAPTNAPSYRGDSKQPYPHYGSYLYYHSNDNDVTASLTVQLKGDKNITCSSSILQDLDGWFVPRFKLATGSETFSGLCSYSCSAGAKPSSTNINSAKSSCVNHSVLRSGGGLGYVGVTMHSPNSYYKAHPITDYLPHQAAMGLSATPILTKSGDLADVYYYRIKIESGIAAPGDTTKKNVQAAFDYFTPSTLQSGRHIPDDPYPGHIHIAFTPYMLYSGNTIDNNNLIGYAIPIATVHLDYNERLLNLLNKDPAQGFFYQTPVTLNGSSDFLYKPQSLSSNENVLTVTQSVIQMLKQDKDQHWNAIAWNKIAPKQEISLTAKPPTINDPSFDLTNYTLKLTAPEGNSLFANGLNQIHLHVSLRDSNGNDLPEKYQWIYQQIYFVNEANNQSIITNLYNAHGYFAISTTPGPYMANNLSNKKYNCLTPKAEKSGEFYLSALSTDSSVQIRARVCVRSQNEIGQLTTKCINSLSGGQDDALGIALKKNNFQGNVFSKKIAFNNALFQPISSSDSKTPNPANAGPIVIDNAAILPYPIIIGLPNYFVDNQAGILNSSINKNVITDNAVNGKNSLHMMAVDVYGNALPDADITPPQGTQNH